MKKLIIATTLCATTAAMSATTISNYGFVKASYMMTDKVNSGDEWKPFFAQDGENTDDYKDEAKSMISSTNSRWGFIASNGSKTSGKFEFDLDATAGSGDQSLSTGRVRQANLVYKVSENATITFGKKWTKFMGANPFTYQATKVSFKAGNNGFLVDGFDYTRTMGNTLFSIELAQENDTATDLVSSPTATIVVGHKMGNHKFGIAHSTANLKHKASTAAGTLKDSTATGTKLYWSGMFGATSAIFQYTMGSNLGSIHTGGIAKAAAGNDEDYKETGILLSAKHAMDAWSVFGSYGVSELADEEEATAASGGVSKNSLMSLGFDKNLDEGLTMFVEYLAFTTGYYDGSKTNDSNGTMTELGMRYKF